MKKDSPFFRQAELMLQILPLVNKETVFALKGGTAINFFVRNMPRLSVDIDLTYLPLQDREATLAGISAALTSISVAIKKAFPKSKVLETAASDGKGLSKLVASVGANQVKIEPNLILRGTLFGEKDLPVSKAVSDFFEMSVTTRCVSTPDLYGGKICALLDRQHPRDMFDVKLLLDDKGITKDIRRAFVVYLAGHARPMEELLDPKLKDMERVYESEFVGMTTEPVAYKELAAARANCVKTLRDDLDEAEKKFLVSMMEQKTEWAVLGIADLEKLPSLQWKLQNIGKMETKKRQTAIKSLKKVLDL